MADELRDLLLIIKSAAFLVATSNDVGRGRPSCCAKAHERIFFFYLPDKAVREDPACTLKRALTPARFDVGPLSGKGPRGRKVGACGRHPPIFCMAAFISSGLTSRM